MKKFVLSLYFGLRSLLYLFIILGTICNVNAGCGCLGLGPDGIGTCHQQCPKSGSECRILSDCYETSTTSSTASTETTTTEASTAIVTSTTTITSTSQGTATSSPTLSTSTSSSTTSSDTRTSTTLAPTTSLGNCSEEVIIEICTLTYYINNTWVKEQFDCYELSMLILWFDLKQFEINDFL